MLTSLPSPGVCFADWNEVFGQLTKPGSTAPSAEPGKSGVGKLAGGWFDGRVSSFAPLGLAAPLAGADVALGAPGPAPQAAISAEAPTRADSRRRSRRLMKCALWAVTSFLPGLML